MASLVLSLTIIIIIIIFVHPFICLPPSADYIEAGAWGVGFTGVLFDADDMATLDGMTTPEAIAKFVELYRKCVVRDTPLPPDGIKMVITEG